jgi:hypothetical protein
MTQLRAACPPAWRCRLDPGLEPAQWIRYERAYLAAFNGRVRITVDRHLAVFDQRHRAVLSPRFRTPLPGVTIVEYKASVAHEARVRELLEACPFPVDKCSKFILASTPALAPVISHLGEACAMYR